MAQVPVTFDDSIVRYMVTRCQTGIVKVFNGPTDRNVDGWTGFFVHPGIIVTVAHGIPKVISNTTNFSVAFHGNHQKFPAYLIAHDFLADFAVMQCQPLASAYIFQFVDQDIRSSTSIFSISHSHQMDWITLRGTVCRPPHLFGDNSIPLYRDLVVFEHDMQTFPGASGAPVLNLSGDVVGMQFYEDAVHHHTYCIPLGKERSSYDYDKAFDPNTNERLPLEIYSHKFLPTNIKFAMATSFIVRHFGHAMRDKRDISLLVVNDNVAPSTRKRRHFQSSSSASASAPADLTGTSQQQGYKDPELEYAGSILEATLKRDPHEVEFIQAVQEVVQALERVIGKNAHYVNIMERLLEPERMIIFRVPWVDDRGETHVNRGFRVQFNQSMGPCRGGIRFHPSMNLSITKFLGFQQTLKNALSPYKLGGAAGGSDFDPKGKTDNEIMRFCQSFMCERYHYLGPDKDLPSEEMGVGTREMGYLFGQYRRLDGHFQGTFTGPRIFWSGSSLRPEATGYGLVFFAQLMLADMNKELKGLRCVVSGSGKIALHVLEKLIAYGALPITVSDSRGYLVDEDGFDYMKVQFLRDIKAQHRSLRDYSKTYARSKYYDEAKPWIERCDLAFACATQNEIDQPDAMNLVNSGCRILIEGSNMPCTPDAVQVLRKANILVAPAMAAGAGGVVAGELELNHECSLMNWSPEDFESKLQEAMKQTYQRAIKAATDFGYQKESPEALVHGAVISAFLTIAQAMTDQDCV